MLYPITTIRHQLGVDLSCIADFHMLKTMFYYQLSHFGMSFLLISVWDNPQY